MKTERDKQLAAVWRATHKDYKGEIDGLRSILILRNGGTTLVALSDLTDEEIAANLPKEKPAPERAFYELRATPIQSVSVSEEGGRITWVSRPFSSDEIAERFGASALPEVVARYDEFRARISAKCKEEARAYETRILHFSGYGGKPNGKAVRGFKPATEHGGKLSSRVINLACLLTDGQREQLAAHKAKRSEAQPEPQPEPPAPKIERAPLPEAPEPSAAEVASYNAKQEARRERYEDRAERATAESQQRYKKFKSELELMNGQPILIGHHSEKGHRSRLRKMDKNLELSCAADDRAKHYRDKAASIGSAGISQDDPEAVKKIKREIETLEQDQEHMNRVNKAWRKAGKPKPDDAAKWALVAHTLGTTPEGVEQYRTALARQSWCKQPFASFTLTNNSANIRRLKIRLAQLTHKAIAKAEAEQSGETERETKHGEIRVVEAVTENRVRIFFPGKPSYDARQELKRSGFRWSPDAGAWQTYMNSGSVHRANEIAKKYA